MVYNKVSLMYVTVLKLNRENGLIFLAAENQCITNVSAELFITRSSVQKCFSVDFLINKES